MNARVAEITNLPAATPVPLPPAKPREALRAVAPPPPSAVKPAPARSPLLAGVQSPTSRAFDRLPQARAIARTRTIHDNSEAWTALWTIASSAKRIDSSYFCLDRDIFGHALLGMMLRKRAEGVPVNLLVDATGDAFGRTGFTMPWAGRRYLEALVSSGASVGVYNPLHRKVVSQLLHPASTRLVASDHTKTFATERYGMTGGRNVAYGYFGSPDDHAGVFHDTDVVVDGAAAAGQLRDALHDELDNDDLVERAGAATSDPRSSYAQLLGSAAMMDAWLARPPFSQAEKTRLRADERARAAYVQPLIDAAIADLTSRGMTADADALKELDERALDLVKNLDLAGRNRGFRLTDGMTRAPVKTLSRTSVAAGDKTFDQITPGLMQLIDSAHRGQRIVITNQYLVLTQNMRRHLEAASARGVRIDVLTNSVHSSDDLLTQAFLVRDWPRLLASCPTMRLFVMDGDEHLHVKSMAIADQVAVVGSYNLDLLSSAINGETVEAVNSPKVARRIAREFARDVADPRKRVVEYTIAKDARGQAVLRDGEPVVTFGPEQHIPQNELASMGFWKGLSHVFEVFPQASSLRYN